MSSGSEQENHKNNFISYTELDIQLKIAQIHDNSSKSDISNLENRSGLLPEPKNIIQRAISPEDQSLLTDLRIASSIDNKTPEATIPILEDLTSDIPTVAKQESLTAESATDIDITTSTPLELQELPILLSIAGQSQAEFLTVLGQDDGGEAVNLEHWLLPLDTFVKLLGFSARIENERWIITGNEQEYTLTDTQVTQNSFIGQAITIAQAKSVFDLDISFDSLEYAVIVDAPWLKLKSTENIEDSDEPTFSLDGLEKKIPQPIDLAVLRQEIDLTRTGSRAADLSGTFEAVGTLFDHGFYVKLAQKDLLDLDSWGIEQLQIIRTTSKADFYLGTQSPFWPEGSGDFLGLTSLFRFGYRPSEGSLGTSHSFLDRRLEPQHFGRSISGKAEPGTIVQLRSSYGFRVIDEVLVDESGQYRFKDVPLDRVIGGEYKLYLYPDAQLDQEPDIYDVKLAGADREQIPAGAGALILSSGIQHEFSSFGSSHPFGKFDNWVGGISGLYGVSDSLTVGAGVAYDDGVLGFSELFWKPNKLPLDASVSISYNFDNHEFKHDSYLNAYLTDDLTVGLNSDSDATQVGLSWQITPDLLLYGEFDTHDAERLELNFSKNINRDIYVSNSIEVASNNYISWRPAVQYRNFRLSADLDNQGKTLATLEADLPQGHSLTASYDRDKNAHFGAFVWDYFSPGRNKDGEPRWVTTLGYGVGSYGSGVLASVQASVRPGLYLRLGYEQISQSSREDRFSIGFVSTFEAQKGFRFGHNRSLELRTRGGLLVKAFLDKNQNGKRDRGEKYYSDPNMIILNNLPLPSHQVKSFSKTTRVQLDPGNYRVDLDPAGLPIGWQSREKAFAAKVSAGSYTPIELPLVPSYTVTGLIKDAQGSPLQGARVEALTEDSEEPIYSITNRYGTYYLEGLQRKTYKLKINGKATQPAKLEITEKSESYFEYNLTY